MAHASIKHILAALNHARQLQLVQQFGKRWRAHMQQPGKLALANPVMFAQKRHNTPLPAVFTLPIRPAVSIPLRAAR